MLNSIKDLWNVIENDPTYDGCAVDLPSGKCIGTTSGGWQPVLYSSPEDDHPTHITWEEALKLYNEEFNA